MLRHKQGQSVLEYIILMVIIIAALIVMRPYLQRHLMGNIRTQAKSISDTQFSMSESANFQEEVVTKSRSKEEKSLGNVKTTQIGNSTTTTTRSIDTKDK